MRLVLTTCLTFLAFATAAQASDIKDGCASLGGKTIAWAGDSARVTAATPVAEGSGLPAHCEISGIMHEREGRFGQNYAIRFRLRLPDTWNERLVFQGGGGSNGVVGDALGQVGATTSALAQGYAVIAQDSGHDNATNSDMARSGALAFGFDPQSRADYGHTSLKASTEAARAILHEAYGRGPRYSYFVGCSKGGQEGMALAQRYPDLFDGIIASAPGFALPRAALAEAWDVQAFASLVKTDGPVGMGDLAKTFTSTDFGLVRAAILEGCDDLDGLKDGMVAAIRHCSDDKVLPKLQARQCAGEKTEACLATAQVAALARVMGGARTSTGEALYSGWYWPASIHAPDWRIWKIGSADGQVPPLNVILGGPALASVFTTPPKALGAPNDIMAYQLSFDFDRDSGGIHTVAEPFTRSAWDDIAARSTDLAAFRARGGKLIVPHGESDPVFSLKDTVDWYDTMNAQMDGRAPEFARVFAIPGMCHCGGGAATDRYDVFTALVAWVEQGKAPDDVVATAGPNSPWPGRTRPLCAWPQSAKYVSGDPEKASSFTCAV